MQNNTKKIVVLDRLDSAHIEQAIFILRDANDITESDAVSEAQRIVNNYLESVSKPVVNEPKKSFHPKHFFALLAYTAATIVITMMVFAK